MALNPWQEELDAYGGKVLGSTRVYLQQKECAWGECNLGNFYTDAMVHAFIKSTTSSNSYWSSVSIALTTQGNFRVPLEIGNLTYNHLVTMCPWENKLMALTLKGSILRDLLEDSVSPMEAFSTTRPTSKLMLQVSGIRVVYNISLPIGRRIVDLRVRCQSCLVPKYEELMFDKDYRLVVMEYLANGKNGHELIRKNARDLSFGPLDLDAFIEYMQIHEPIYAGLENRITVLT